MSARWWPLIPVVLLVLCVLGQAAIVVASRGKPGLTVEPNYYERAVRWDAERGRSP